MKPISEKEYQRLLELKQLLTAWLSEASKLAPETRTGFHAQANKPHNVFLAEKYDLLRQEFMKTKTTHKGITVLDISDPITAIIGDDGGSKKSWEIKFKRMRETLNVYLDEVKVVKQLEP
jgi:hypothetical protein